MTEPKVGDAWEFPPHNEVVEVIKVTHDTVFYSDDIFADRRVSATNLKNFIDKFKKLPVSFDEYNAIRAEELERMEEIIEERIYGQ